MGGSVVTTWGERISMFRLNHIWLFCITVASKNDAIGRKCEAIQNDKKLLQE